MGYLMKEALKALCGVNQWSFAVFWKFGSNNPKLLIWEECYYETYTSSKTATNNNMGNQGMTLQTPDGYHLVDKMMMSNQVNVVGEGLVGRAAFTGNHQWIVSGNCHEFSYPAEVLHEVNVQFSAGVQTIVVIPVMSHGVVQFGSPLTISENVGFLNDVRSLITQLGRVPSAFIPDNYITKDDCMSGLPTVTDVSIPFDAGTLNRHRNSSDSVINQSSNSLLTNFQDNLLVSDSSFIMNSLTQDSLKFHGHNYAAQTNTCAPSSVNPPKSVVGNRITRDSAMKHLTNNPGPRISCPKVSTDNDLEAGIYVPQSQSFLTSAHVNNMFLDDLSSMDNLVAVMKTVEQSSSSSMLTSLPYYDNINNDGVHKGNCIPNQVEDIDNIRDCNQALPSNNFISENSFFQSAAGDDLFDVLGMDLKSKLLNGNDSQIKGLPRSMNFHNFGSGIYRDYDGVSDSGVLSSGSDHLLDAVISGFGSAPRQTSDDSMSCRTTASKISSSSMPSTPRSNPAHTPSSVGLFTMADSMQQQLFGSSCGKMDRGIRSTTSSPYGSQISSWIEQGPATSVSTANSKKSADETGKANRKRLKPGESPRPRPKDRQMIQDRVKELRDIIPNGAKCSIDSLLERTIKHMLFLQSVASHADKLKHTESKINRKEGGMPVKDNFEGGATWAFELGSQSMVCPIVVEDLNPPRQLIVEMLCEERGFFLEIADIIRGLGLTILKGVMEARNDKIWGKFAVEADRDVTRMEVFISLVHLLEQTMNSHGAPTTGIIDDKVVYPLGPIVCGEPPAM